MKRFIITEDEKYQILSLYKEKKIIIEQTENYNYGTSSETDRGFDFFTTKPNAGVRSVGSDEYKKTIAAKSKVDKLVDSTNKALWDEIFKQDEIFAANTIKYVERNTWIKYVGFRKQGQPEKKTEASIQTTYPNQTIQIPIGNRTNFYFIDNEWDLLDQGKKDIDTNIIEPAINSKGQNRGCIELIQVNSSASRIRNGGKAEDKSFAELSKLRNDSVKNYVLTKLQSSGFDQWCSGKEKLTQNYLGSNQDGTSGPNPAKQLKMEDGAMKSFYFVPRGQKSMNPPSNDEKKRGEYGTPHANKVDYDVYKYSNPLVIVAFETKIQPPENETQPQEKTSNKYIADFKGTMEGQRRYTPDSKLKINIPVFKTERNKVDSGQQMCPIFNNP